MPRLPLPSSLSSYYTASFNLKHHIQEFLHFDSEIVESRLETSQQQMAELGHKDFYWEQATAFSRDRVGEFYLFDL
ncbi:MAG: SAM-dependent methyltransferase, partial [Sphaerospermopsis kisseleviana]